MHGADNTLHAGLAKVKLDTLFTTLVTDRVRERWIPRFVSVLPLQIFVLFFCFCQECLGSGDGIAAGQTVLEFSKKQTCVGEEEQAAFLAEMDAVFKERCRGYHTASIPTCVMIQSVERAQVTIYLHNFSISFFLCVRSGSRHCCPGREGGAKEGSSVALIRLGRTFFFFL